MTVAVWGGAIAVFATVGWMALAPHDPHGAMRMPPGAAILLLPQVLALAIVVAGVTTALIGRKLPDVGTFAVAIGLACANLQGASAAYLLRYVTGTDVAARRALCRSLAVEGVLWFVVIVIASLTSAVVMRWLYGRGKDAEHRLSHMSACGVPFFGRLACGPVPTAQSTPAHIGLMHMAVTAVVAIVLVRMFASGTAASAVKQGQVYFALAAAFFLGRLLAQKLFPTRTALWACLSVPLVCIIGYVWTMMRAKGPGPYADIASVPPTAFFRALPVEYISVGTAAVLASFWGSLRPRVGGKRSDQSEPDRQSR